MIEKITVQVTTRYDQVLYPKSLLAFAFRSGVSPVGKIHPFMCSRMLVTVNRSMVATIRKTMEAKKSQS